MYQVKFGIYYWCNFKAVRLCFPLPLPRAVARLNPPPRFSLLFGAQVSESSFLYLRSQLFLSKPAHSHGGPSSENFRPTFSFEAYSITHMIRLKHSLWKWVRVSVLFFFWMLNFQVVKSISLSDLEEDVHQHSLQSSVSFLGFAPLFFPDEKGSSLSVYHVFLTYFIWHLKFWNRYLVLILEPKK